MKNRLRFTYAVYRYRFYGLSVVVFAAILSILSQFGWLEHKTRIDIPLEPATTFELNFSHSTLLTGTVTAVIPYLSITSTPTVQTVLIQSELDIRDGHRIRLGSVLTIPGVGFGVVTDVSTGTTSTPSRFGITVTTQSENLALGERVKLYATTPDK